MADQSSQPDADDWRAAYKGAVPRMDLDIPVPAGTKEPPAPKKEKSAQKS